MKSKIQKKENQTKEKLFWIHSLQKIYISFVNKSI